jgi:NAD(P)-dependent dehydrogenase (short-subunit alcohol dehydrogenase family)
MSLSFSATETGALAKTEEKRRLVLVTGAAGRIGSYFALHAQGKYDFRLMVRESDDTSQIEGLGEIVVAELSELEKLRTFCEGVDTVVHMAGDPDAGDTWQNLLDANIIGTYNIMVAAKSAGCRRVIYASSIHAVSGYPADMQVKTSEPVNPGDLYGVSKCFGEALGRYMAEQEGVSVIALRIGAFQPLESVQSEKGIGMLDGFVSHRDLHQLIEKCVDVENVRWAVLHGLSDNRFKRMDISDARALVGYAPQDDATQHLPGVKELNLSERVQSHGQIVDSGLHKSGLREELEKLAD